MSSPGSVVPRLHRDTRRDSTKIYMDAALSNLTYSKSRAGKEEEQKRVLMTGVLCINSWTKLGIVTTSSYRVSLSSTLEGKANVWHKAF